MSTVDDLKPWQQVIVYTFMIVLTIGMVVLLIFGSAKFGLIFWDMYKVIGWLAIPIFILGVLSMALLWITVNFSMAVVRRIMKWKWLQIPME